MMIAEIKPGQGFGMWKETGIHGKLGRAGKQTPHGVSHPVHAF